MKKTGNRVLLDTNIIIEVLNGNTKFANKIKRFDEFAICAVALGELHIGINRVANKPKHLKILNDFLLICPVVDVTSETAVHYGEIMAGLYKKGKPIPTNDIWIAACARQYGYTLISQDKHFKEIVDLNILSW